MPKKVVPREHPYVEWLASDKKISFYEYMNSLYPKNTLLDKSYFSSFLNFEPIFEIQKWQKQIQPKPNEYFGDDGNLIPLEELFTIQDQAIFPTKTANIVDFIYDNLSVDPALVDKIQKELKKFVSLGDKYKFDKRDDEFKELEARLMSLAKCENDFTSFNLNEDYYIKPEYRVAEYMPDDVHYMGSTYVDTDGKVYKSPKAWEEDRKKESQFVEEKKKQKIVMTKSYIERKLKEMLVATKIYSHYNQDGINLIGRCSWFDDTTDLSRGHGRTPSSYAPKLPSSDNEILKVNKRFSLGITPSKQRDYHIAEKGEDIYTEVVSWMVVMGDILNSLFSPDNRYGEDTSAIAQQGLMTNEEWNVMVDVVIDNLMENPEPIVDKRNSYGTNQLRYTGSMKHGNYESLTYLFTKLIAHQYLCDVNGVIPFSPPSTIDYNTKGVYLIDITRHTNRKHKSSQEKEKRKPHYWITSQWIGFDIPDDYDIRSYRRYEYSNEQMMQFFKENKIRYKLPKASKNKDSKGDVRLILPKMDSLQPIWDFANVSLNMLAEAFLKDLRLIISRTKQTASSQKKEELKRFIDEMNSSTKMKPLRYMNDNLVDEDGNEKMMYGNPYSDSSTFFFVVERFS